MRSYQKTIYALLLFAIGNNAKGQLTSGSSGLFLKSGTVLSSEGLVLTPTTDLSITSNTLTKSSTSLYGDAGQSINRVYTFSNQITYTGSVGIYYLDSELNGNTASELAISYKNPSVTVTETSSNVNTTTKLVTVNFSNTTIAQLTAVNKNVVLPVDLKDFTAVSINNRVKISWETLMEKDHDYFEIESSTDGGSFLSLGKIKGEGNSNEVKKYEVYDSTPSNGNNYYRLLQYDKDGKRKDYGVKIVKFGLSDNLIVRVFPNPVAKEVHIQLNNGKSEDLEVSLFNLNGQLIHQQLIKANGNDYSLLLNQKPAAGLYLLKLRSKSTNHSTKLLVQ
ncbi:MAG: T9SS type A sorting domain-containing protein [Pedobacter sp.]|nr:MAG: T9SS type A sorting domain-containing protein [Pedobacter sp.]